MPATILFLAANPAVTVRLALDEEVRAIEQTLRGTDRRDELRFVSRWAVRPDDLLQHLNEQQATIVHFSGHGEGDAGLMLQADGGESRPTSAEALRGLFHALRGGVRVVLFNACHSHVQAEAVVQEIDCVIGMTREVGDDAARVFATSFYRAIGFGHSVLAAYDQARAALLLAGVAEACAPQLLVRAGVDAAQVFPLARPAVASPAAAPTNAPPRIALIAAAADQPWVRKLQVHLKPLVRPHGVDVWDPSKIAAGRRVRDEITANLASARAVVVFVSPELFADEELADVRLPVLLAAAGRSLALLSLIVSACAFTDSELGELKPLNDPDLPLDALTPPELNRRLVEVAREVLAAAT